MRTLILMAGALLVGCFGFAGDRSADAAPRAAWMSGRYGLMVHWLFASYTGRPESVTGPVDRFDIERFLADFDETGASWLFFTIGQNTGGYASPNAELTRLCGPNHCPSRDLVSELAAAMHARGKRFVAYLPGDSLVKSISMGAGWNADDPYRVQYQTNWTGVIREWSVRLGSNLDGWWFDGMTRTRYPKGFDERLWADAARAGNPNAIVAFNRAMVRATANGFEGVTPGGGEVDYLAGELQFLENGRIRGGCRPETWMPETAYVKGTKCLHHVLFPLDGFWTAWAPWHRFAPGTAVEREHPELFSAPTLKALRDRGEFPPTAYSAADLRRFVRDFTRVGGAVTINVGVSAEGRLNTHSLACLKALRPKPAQIGWMFRPTAADGSVETRGEGVWAYAGTAQTVGGTEFWPMSAGSALGNDVRLSRCVYYTKDAFAANESEPAAVRLTAGGLWRDGFDTGAYTLTLRGLSPGGRYLVQLWFADRRPCGLDRATGVFGERTVLAHRTSEAPFGQTAVGVFTACADEQPVVLTPCGVSFQVNAIQLRRFKGDDEPIVPDAAELVAPDDNRSPDLAATRLKGFVGEKADRFLARRVYSEYARKTMFAEAEKAFETHFDDDPSHPGAGYWQGEYWGKEMLGLIEGSIYGHDDGLKAWALERARELIRRHQRPNGAITTYRDEEYLRYSQGWNWNLWGRKYTLWAFLEIYEATGAQDILLAARRLMDQQIEMLHRLKLPIWETGCYVGLPSMSVLKPLLLLYRHTNEPRYLDYAREIVDGWRREGNPAPNLLVNAFSERPVADWYGVPHEWAKAYEFMSCLEGLVEFYRVTGERSVLDAAERIWDKLARDETNPVGTVAYFDHFFNAARMTNGASEPCDSTHWIRVSRELFLVTGSVKYLDAIERTFLNGFLAGVWRDGSWGAHMVRSHGRRHRAAPTQIGIHESQCCVANMPRTFFDVARTAVTRTKEDGLSVNLFNDCEVSFGDVKVKVSGNYPVSDDFTISVDSSKPVSVRFRVPEWCPSLKVDGKTVWMLETKTMGGWRHLGEVTKRTFAVHLDMPVKVVSFGRVPYVACTSEWAWKFWACPEENPEAGRYFRTTPAARLERGPLILAKARALGCADAEIFDFETVNARGFDAKLEPIKPVGVWGAWKVTLTGHRGEKVETKVCDFQSAADFDDVSNAFSVWF